MKNAIFLYFMLFLLFGCARNDKGLQQQIQAAVEISQERTYPNKATHPLQAGQWAKYVVQHSYSEEMFRLIQSSPETEVYTISVTAVDNTSFLLQQTTLSTSGETHVEGLVSGLESQDATQFKIESLRFSDKTGKVASFSGSEIESGSADEAKDALKFLLNILIQSHKADRYRTVTVPAGTFLQAKQIPFSFSTLLGQEKGNILFSKAIPVLGVAELSAVRISSAWFKETERWQLLDFGWSDANSYFSKS